MLYLVATIILNVIISALFKVFPKYKIDTLQAIVTNYCVCVVTGSLFIGHIPYTTASFHAAWLPWCVLMGASFISIFNLIAYCTRLDGITTTTIANKLSLVIPVVFSIFLYHEASGLGKIIGIVLAFPAVYLTSRVKGEENKAQNLFWPIVLFIFSGLLDTLMKYVQISFLPTTDVQATYTIYCFSVAAVIGLTLVSSLLLMKKISFHWRNVVAGICVGVPNYFSIYFLICALNSDVMQSSATIPVVNIGILVASALMAILFFKEKANALRSIGLLLSVVAILLIAFGDK